MSVASCMMCNMRINLDFNRKMSQREAARKSQMAFLIVDNIRKEIEANPELIENYSSEVEVANEVMRRMKDMEDMERMADTLRGNWREQLLYKLNTFNSTI